MTAAEVHAELTDVVKALRRAEVELVLGLQFGDTREACEAALLQVRLALEGHGAEVPSQVVRNIADLTGRAVP